MVKKIVSIMLCLLLSIGVLCGCNLFVHNIERDYQRVIAEIPETRYSYSGEENGDKGTPYCNYKGGEYLLSGGNVYYAENLDASSNYNDYDSYALLKKDGKISVYCFAEERVADGTLSESDLAEIKDILTFKKVEEGSTVQYKNYDVTLPARKIYKTELVNYMNNYLSNYVNSFGYSVEDTIDLLLDALIVNRGLLINEGWKFVISGKILLTQADFNYIEESVYSSIDAELRTLQEDILEEKGLTAPDYDSEDTDDEEAETTWPIPTEDVETEEKYNEEPWNITDEKNRNRWPGIVGDVQQKSLELEAMRRYIIQLQDTIDADFRMTAEQRQRAQKDIENFRNIQNSKGIEYVYPELGDSFIIDYIYRSGIMDTYLTDRIRSYMEDQFSGSVTVTDDEVQKRYEDLLKTQREEYDETLSDYDTAISNEDTIYYHPDVNRYFFVKHILLQFSDEQKAYLDAFNKNPNHTKQQQIDERNRLATEISAYAHKDGEDDTSVSYSASQIFNEVKTAVDKYAANPTLAIREFDKLIYKYNQDPGGFNKKNGYAVRTKLDEGETDNWVAEFSEAARDLYNNSKAGTLYPELIVTDYGVHIMIYVGKISKSVMSLSDYTGFDRTTTYAETVRNELFEKKTSERYEQWQQDNIYKMIDNEDYVKVYNNTFKDLYKA